MFLLVKPTLLTLDILPTFFRKWRKFEVRISQHKQAYEEWRGILFWLSNAIMAEFFRRNGMLRSHLQRCPADILEIQTSAEFSGLVHIFQTSANILEYLVGLLKMSKGCRINLLTSQENNSRLFSTDVSTGSIRSPVFTNDLQVIRQHMASHPPNPPIFSPQTNLSGDG